MQIEEIKNDKFPNIQPVKESMDINIPDIEDENIPRKNGSIIVFTGSGGSGKTSLMLNFFKHNELYKRKFHNVYYICPESSFLSVKDHPFKNHDKVVHELTSQFLEMLYYTLEGIKTATIDNIEKSKKKKDKPIFDDDEKYENEEIDTELKYNCVIFDDMANTLKKQ